MKKREGSPCENSATALTKINGVEDSIRTWVKIDGCEDKEGDETKVTSTTYGSGKDKTEVVLVVVEGGGHTWPGQPSPLGILGKSAKNFSAIQLPRPCKECCQPPWPTCGSGVEFITPAPP